MANQDGQQARGPHRFAFPALLVGNAALAFGPWLVRLADTGAVAAGFWRLALALPFLAILGPGEMFGGTAPATIWHDFMADAANPTSCGPFPDPTEPFVSQPFFGRLAGQSRSADPNGTGTGTTGATTPTTPTAR